MQKIKTFEDACRSNGIETNLPDVSGLMKNHQQAVISFYKLSVIASALNEGWEKDWTDDNEYIYYPWWYVKHASNGSFAGLAFAGTDHAVSNASAVIGSRLGFKTLELARYAANQFKDIYEDFLLFTNTEKNDSDQSE